MLINRTGNAPSFLYDSKGTRITDKNVLAYIKSLSIPPMYTKVVIHVTMSPEGPKEPPKLTYTGTDDKSRTQYGYSKAWKEKSKKLKYKALIPFGVALPKIRKSVNSTLSARPSNGYPTRELCIALIIRIIMSCNFRLGNIKYKNMYKSHGITNIEVRHIKFKANNANIAFIGKKGVHNECRIDDAETITHLKRLTAGKTKSDHVFIYDSGGGCTVYITANDINEWMKRFSVDISSKMFRTYTTNIIFIEMIRELDPPEGLSENARKKNINAVLDSISSSIHNTRAVCKKEYMHPSLIEMYIEHPRRYKKLFISAAAPEAAFISFLRTN